MPRQYAVGQRRLERKRTSRKKVMSILKNMIGTYSKVRRGTNGLSKAGHQWLSELLAHLNPAIAHSVFSLTRLTRFRPSVWLPWSWGAQSGVVASLLHSAPYPALTH